LGDGNFYFIEHVEKVDESFVDALGALFSSIASEVNICLTVKEDKLPFTTHSIHKTYGDMWMTAVKSKEYTINMTQLMCGISKEFVFDILMPKCDFKVGDSDCNPILI
jgi:hypothetical protein